MNTSSSSQCPRCGSPVEASAVAGLCPKCLMARAVMVTEGTGLETGLAALPALEEVAAAFPELEVIELIGRGGMGVVYKAKQKSLNRLVALKLLAPERVTDSHFAERFEREAQALAALNHPNIVTVHDFGEAGGFYFLLMEFVDGVNLRQAMQAGRFTPEQALAIVPPVCEALQYAHEHGIVHRDIKPENLLLDKEGRVKIADFGIAKLLGTEASETISQPVGTPRYMAPEQGGGVAPVDHRADIYSLGVVLYELLTGELPSSRLEAPSRKVHIDVRLDEVVLRALSEKPELRWQTALELKTQVQTLAQSPDMANAPQQRLYHAMGYHTVWGQRLLKLSLVGLLGFLGFIPGLEKLQVLSVFTVLMAVAGIVEWVHKRKHTVASERSAWWHRVLGKIVIALIIVIPLRTWVIQAFVINGKSLEPEMPPGSHMLVWKLSNVYAPGDIVAHHHGDQVWVSRVVRVEKDHLVLQRNQWPEEKVPRDDIIGKVISVYWRASPAMPSASAVASPTALTLGPATVDLDKKPQLRFLQYYYRGDEYRTPVYDTKGKLLGPPESIEAIHASRSNASTMTPNGPDDCFVRVWFEHPSWDPKSELTVDITNADGTKLDVKDAASSGAWWSSSGPRPLALSSAQMVGQRGHMPKAIRVTLRYSMGNWENTHLLKADFYGVASVASNSLLGGFGSNNRGNAFVNWTRPRSLQLDAVALLKSGKELQSINRTVGGNGDVERLNDAVEFPISFADVKAFQFRSRAIQEMEFENILVPQHPGSAAVDDVQPKTKQVVRRKVDKWQNEVPFKDEPKLRYMTWLNGKATDEIHLFTPEGEQKTGPADIPEYVWSWWVKNVLDPSRYDSKDLGPHQRQLLFFFSHPAIDDSSEARVELFKPDGSELELKTWGSIKEAPRSPKHEGWMVVSRPVDEALQGSPRKVQLQLTAGTWLKSDDYPVGYDGGNGWGFMTIGRNGEDQNHKAFMLVITANRKKDNLEPQWSALATLKTGDIVSSDGAHAFGDNGRFNHSVNFAQPLSEISSFFVRWRTPKVTEFKDVHLPPLPNAK